MRRELERLALLRDDEIDTIDIPEEVDWSAGQRSRFSQRPPINRNYDVRALANWFIDQMMLAGRSVTNLSLNKLVYFAVERFLVERNILLTPAKIEAWQYGPVFREIYHALSQNENKQVEDKISKFSVQDRRMVIASADIKPDDIAFLTEIVETYGSLTAGQLTSLSHKDDEPWFSVWNYRGRINPGMEISMEAILNKAPKKRKFNDRK